MITIPNKSFTPKAFLSLMIIIGCSIRKPLYQHIVDVCEELVKFTYLIRGRTNYLTERYNFFVLYELHWLSLKGSHVCHWVHPLNL